MSFYILVQGIFPILWSIVSEMKGRKLVYILSITFLMIGSIVIALSKNIGLVIGMRTIQAIGSSGVLLMGAATLADVYDPHQRGTMVGIYCSAPLLGPSIGPIMGGVLTQTLGWRAIFWFLAIWGGIMLAVSIFLFKDTFRRERSSIYQAVLQRIQRLPDTEVASGVKKSACGDMGKFQEKSTDVEAARTTKAVKDVTVTFTDVNPVPAYVKILGDKNNLAIILSTGLGFGLSCTIGYTCARTLSLYYNYDALKTAFVLLFYGIGGIFGSILGGRWSDRSLMQMKAANGGVSSPEERLESTKVAMWGLPPSVVAHAWVCQERVHIAAMCATLFFTGFFLIWIYLTSLAYIVDANVGRSSSAVATNSSCSGVIAFISLEVAVPLQDGMGDGGLYIMWAGLMLILDLIVLVVLYKGKQWREKSSEKGSSQSADRKSVV